MNDRLDRSIQHQEYRDLLSRSSLGCPRTPISCGHLLVDHAGDGWDEDGQPTYPRCRVPGCDCDGVS